MSTGRLFGVGVGPGDPELLTLKARRVIEAAAVVAYPTARHGRSVSRRIAAPFIRDDQIEVALTFPMTTEETQSAEAYEAALAGFYDESAAVLAGHLDAGRDVAVLCEGDPFFYGSYMYLHQRLAHRYETEVIPGVTSFSAAAAAAGRRSPSATTYSPCCPARCRPTPWRRACAGPTPPSCSSSAAASTACAAPPSAPA